MAEESPAAGGVADAPRAAFRNEDGAIAESFLTAVTEAILAGDAEQVRALVGELHSADLGDVLQALEPEARPLLIRLIGPDFDFTALTELDETARAQILEALPTKAVAEGIRDLESDDAVYILEDLDQEARDEILAQLSPPERLALRRSLDYPEESAGRRMQTDFIAVPPFWTVGQTIDHMREAKDLPDEFYEIFVIDPAYRLVGTVALNKLLRAKRATRISEVMEKTRHLVRAEEDQEEVARLFERYNLVSAAVVDEAERLVGVLTVDDIVDVIQEEADEDIRRLGGVGDEEASDTIFYIARTRIPWLLVNALTAFLAAAVIGLFDATIEQMVALAVLMPIVASMGGNAGIQALTIAVRTLATRNVSRQTWRLVGREVAVGLINGLVIALLIGTGAALWFSNVELGVVIAIALLGNILTAGFFGALIPFTLTRLNIDPAPASGVFLTAITDVVGFFAFLGLAAWWFGLG